MGNEKSSLNNYDPNAGVDFAYGGRDVLNSNPLGPALSSIPMPDIDELNEMFHQALNNMDLTPEQFNKLKDTYNNEEKWKLVQEQDRQQVKNTPQYYWLFWEGRFWFDFSIRKLFFILRLYLIIVNFLSFLYKYA